MSAPTAPSDRAGMLRQFASLHSRQQIRFLVAATEVIADGVLPDGPILDRMCSSLAQCDLAWDVKLGRKRKRKLARD